MLLKAVESYVHHLEGLAADLAWFSANSEAHSKVENALNGELAKTLRQVVPQAVLQKYGAFFTSSTMSDLIHSQMQQFVPLNQPVMDLACGGGNLLLARAKKLPIRKSLESTLLLWGELLHGADIHEEFIRATCARLVLLAAQRGCFYGQAIPSLKKLFPHMVVQNSLKTTIPDIHMILNPPFTYVKSPPDCEWAGGKVTQAALFITQCLESLSAGKVVAAILPEILRSGSNYKAWRVWVSRRADILEMQSLGRFDAETNVDVFLLILKVRPITSQDLRSGNWVAVRNTLPNGTQTKLANHCAVNVGRVVPHRDKDIGDAIPYLDVKQAPAWKQIQSSAMVTRGFQGVTFKPPFVVVRRNSRSKDAKRAVATLVRGKKRVAVENHLMVLTPTKHTLAGCHEVIRVLQDTKTDAWLNTVIRCRHLTVQSLLDIPWWDQ